MDSRNFGAEIMMRDPVAAQVDLNRVFNKGIENFRYNNKEVKLNNPSAFSYLKKGTGNEISKRLSN